MLTDCTVSGNSASGSTVPNYPSQGGGVYTGYSGTTTTLTNCTVSGNSTGGYGGGLYNIYTNATLTNCTVSGNSALAGGGLFDGRGTTTENLGNTIVAGNTASTASPDVDGTVASQGNNLIGATDGSSGWVSSDLTGTVAAPLDAVLAPLGNYGGPTQTMALLPGSPAIDAGNNSLIPSGVTRDQRGYTRIYHFAVDIGAFELLPPPLSIAVSPKSATLAKGLTGQFTAMGTFAAGENLDITSSVTWASATPSVATINSTGLATALATGTSVITASLADVTSPADTLTVIGQGFVVSNTNDSGPGSLRQAILDSNNAGGATNTIDFDIPGPGVQTIDPLTSLPAISNPVLIDGFSQPGYAGTPLIELNGSKVPQIPHSQTAGLTITGSGVTVRGLDIDRFYGDGQGAGVRVTGIGATGDWIYGNFLGTDPTGTQAEANAYGVVIDGGASGNLIGTNGDGINDAAERNVISGNVGAGVTLTGQGTDGNVVAGNLIGTTVTGDVTLPNGVDDFEGGVEILGGASGNRIGTDGLSVDAAGQGNVISGNFDPGVLIDGSSDNVVAGNFIGTDATGSVSLPNQPGGIRIVDGSSDNTIGGTTAGAGNLITDNVGPGVVVGVNTSDPSLGNQITANRIFANTGQAIDLDDDGVTDNGTSPRQGPNNRQNFPIFVLTADGQTEVWLQGSTPDTTFRIEFFASAGYGPGGSGEAQDYLGSLEVTTNASGQVGFAVPFTAPAGLPIITATATDPQGNTSEVSSLRQATLQVPSGSLRAVPNQSLALTTQAGGGIVIEDPQAGPTNPVWDLTLSVSDGTLTLSSTAGLTGSGNGTGSLSYSGPLAALNAALQGLIFHPPAGSHVLTTLTVGAQSFDAQPLPTEQFVITDGVFVVDTTADSGPGSLRQAILDANTVTGLTVTIDFAIPGGGVQTIAPVTPLPSITASVQIDGTSQPGFAGVPLIDLTGQELGGSEPLTTDSSVTIRGVAIDGFALGAAVAVSDAMALQSVPLPGSGGGPGAKIDSYRLETSTGKDLTVVVQARGVTTRLTLTDASGNVLMQSDGQSAADGDDLINLYVPAGTYFLNVQDLGGAGTYSLTATSMPSVAPFQPITVGQQFGLPDTIVAANFTGSGHTDLAVLNGDNTMSILLGNGDGTFQPPVTYPVGPVSAMIAGEFTGDGHTDLAFLDGFDNTVFILLGNGDGTFQPPVAYAVGSSPFEMVAGDFTGDGHTDLAVTNFYDNTVSILLGNGDGTFQPQVTYAVGEGPTALVAGDFTGDGRLDLAAVVAGGVSVVLGNGDGSFQSPVLYPVVDGVLVGLVTANFTSDGHTDLAVAGITGVWVFFGKGDGTFQNPVLVPTPSSAFNTMITGDFNGDGHTDLASPSNTNVSILLGNGDGTFQPEVNYATGLSGGNLVTGDFNGDGYTDLALNNESQPGLVTVLFGNREGSFQNQVANVVGSYPDAMVTGDFTGNGHTDLAVANEGDNSVSILLGNGDGTFQPQATYPVGSYPDAMVTGDFNGDGSTDLAVLSGSDDTVSILLGNGNGTFQPQVTYPLGDGGGDQGADPDAIVAADLTGDGHTDLAVADYSNNTVLILLGNGDGTFVVSPVTYPVGPDPVAMVAGDFTGDGHTDLAVAFLGPNRGMASDHAILGGVSVLLGNGDGTFQPEVNYAVGPHPDAIVAGEFTGDGHTDLAVFNYGGYIAVNGVYAVSGSSVSILLGRGNGTFQPQVTYPLGLSAQTYYPDEFVTADLTGDGHADLAVANYNRNTVSILLGNGDGTFQDPVTYPMNVPPTGLVTGDFTGDGHADLAVVNNSSNSVSVLLNLNGSFVPAGSYVTNPQANPIVADVTGDGIDDVLVVDGAGDILYRQGIPGQPGSFEPPVTVNPPLPDGSNPYTSHDIAWLPDTNVGPVLASVDAKDDAISFYGYRDGRFVRLDGSLTTGQLPAQIVAAQLDGNGLDDLVVRNAGDGTLSVYLGSGFVGTSGTLAAPIFTAAFIYHVGLGVSDVQAIDTTGTGVLDLVVTNELSGLVGVLRNLGDGSFAPSVSYRASAGLYAVTDNGDGTDNLTAREATAGVAAGPLAPGGPTDLVTINPGSNTLDVLAGLGGGRFANPVPIDTPSPAEVVREADFTGNGVADLAVLTANGVSIYLGNGKGGFSPPVTYNAGTDPTGLTVADLLGNGHLDLLVGNAAGDVLILVGNGDGTFRPFEPVKAAIALAVADLTGNGVPDFVFANQSLNQVSVVFGTTGQNANSPAVIGNQTTGVLAPGAVLLADLNGDKIPDLVVANSGGNNVLVYPGLGNGQFGPPVNGTKGFAVGTDPTGLTVANLNGQPDLLVADTGSNDVSVLLGRGSGSSWTMVSGARIQTDAGPVALVVGHLLGPTQTDLAVANSGSDNVQIFPGIGGGFFNDQATAVKTYAVGQAPSSLFLGNFNGLGPGTGHAQLGLEQRDLDRQPRLGQPGAPDVPDRRRLADDRIRSRLHAQRLP